MLSLCVSVSHQYLDGLVCAHLSYISKRVLGWSLVGGWSLVSLQLCSLNGHLCPLLLPYSLPLSNTPAMSHSITPLQIFGGPNCFAACFKQKPCQGQYFGATQDITLLITTTRVSIWGGKVGGAGGGLEGAWRRQRNKETRPHCTDMEPAAILTRDKGDDYDDVQVVGLTIWQQEICRISEVGIFVVYLKWVY